MKNIFAITFHAAHNFGSALQSFALKKFTEDLFNNNNKKCNYKILNFRTDFQKNLYSTLPKVNSLKAFLKLLMRIPYVFEYSKKHRRFENFINQELNTTIELDGSPALKRECEKADCLISGSDQIWNVRARDFNYSYFLDFIEDKKKISYAASMGPLEINWESYDKQKVAGLLREYSGISVREKGTAENIEYLLGKKAEIHIDPTLLLSKEQWQEIESKERLLKNKYILLYMLEPSKKQLEVANNISRALDLPIVITRYNNKNDYFNHYKKLYSTGPKEFLSLIHNAQLVITTSFHGTAFSLIYEKPFFVIDGLEDNRISTLLEITGLEERSINNVDYIEKVKNAFDINFFNANIALKNERKKSEEYLWKQLLK